MCWRLQPYVLVAATLPARPRRGAQAGALLRSYCVAASASQPASNAGQQGSTLLTSHL